MIPKSGNRFSEKIMLYLNVAARLQRRHETFPASARRYSCCSGSSDSCRTATWARAGAGCRARKATSDSLAPSARTVLSCAIRPSATTARSFFISAIVGSQKIAAGSYFFRSRLVFGRHAAHRIGDPAVDQFKSIVGMCAVFTARKAELAERARKAKRRHSRQ